MRIDDRLVTQYLNQEDISDAWIFHQLQPGEHLYSDPELSRDEIRQMNNLVKEQLNRCPLRHPTFFDTVFPDWRSVFQNDMHVMLVVGCPYPYDAMTRIKDGEPIMIFDLNRLYASDPDRVSDTIQRMITHEFFHVLYAKDFEGQIRHYEDELLNLTFNEGFAHYLSLDDIIKEGYEKYKTEHYAENLAKLKDALGEEDSGRQKQHLTDANTGNLFDKFAAVVGMFILLENEDKLEAIYRSGYQNFLSYV